MSKKVIPLSMDALHTLTETYPTPFHIYDERGIRENARLLQKAFSWNPGFKEYFAVKATPNPYILSLLKAEGFGGDCSSYPEMVLCDKVGMRGEDVIFTSNDTPAYEYAKAKKMGAIINLDDISHIAYLEEHVGLPELVCCRYNPGPLKGGNVIIGKPEEAKYGFTREQLFEGYRQLRDKGVKRFGLHTMVASNELEVDYFVETAQLLFDLVAELTTTLGISFEFVNLGGGIGIPYRPEEEPVDLLALGEKIRALYEKSIVKKGLAPLDIRLECGRMVTGPYGWLIGRVLHKKETYKNYIGLDASMANLMRPGMYGAYHHVSIAGKEKAAFDYLCDITGSLCENNDKFAIDRSMPNVDVGDLAIIHDAGAHGHSMGFNYNAKLRSAELLLRESGEVVQIRRAETMDDYFTTLDFNGFEQFVV
ncbi:MAG TPA: diaminopimelate decarboxylase [Verrucomicrobia bacterium]|nr:diaminopimelate decarboxylase [Verrucomicrobiota bacterium]